MFRTKCKITFIAHGATIHSEEYRFSDKVKYPPLNSSGEQEIDNICAWLEKRAVKNDKIYSSEALRTVQSAQKIADFYHDDFEIIKGLTPRNMGILSGVSFDEAEEKFPEILSQLYSNAKDYTPEGAESLADFNKRIHKIVKNIVESNCGNRIIVVTHPDIIQSVVAKVLGVSVNNQFKAYIRTGTATQISYFEGWASLLYSDHLPL